jgi:hypothetical protein
LEAHDLMAKDHLSRFAKRLLVHAGCVEEITAR